MDIHPPIPPSIPPPIHSHTGGLHHRDHAHLPTYPPTHLPIHLTTLPILPHLPSLLTYTQQVGFTIEGRDDAELPEVMLGVAKFNKLDVRRAHPLTLDPGASL